MPEPVPHQNPRHPPRAAAHAIARARPAPSITWVDALIFGLAAVLFRLF